MFEILQRVILPNPSFNAPQTMYMRTSKDVAYDYNEQKIFLPTDSEVSFDTYFNSFTVAKWKSYCKKIEEIQLSLFFSGDLTISIKIINDTEVTVLNEVRLTSATTKEHIISIPPFNSLPDGILFFSIFAQSPSILKEGFFKTPSKSLRNVKLGIVITHFNRKDYVVPAIKRIKEELLDDENYKDKVELIVVDNSQTLTDEETNGVICLPNPNFGGSGGFTRGLLYLVDNKSFSHCLFMDDDGSCEIESIRRMISLLEHTTSDRVAVAGSLIKETEPDILYEKGAKFEGICRPLFNNVKLSDSQNLSYIEEQNILSKSDYGAWWFFGFKIDEVKSYPFPFFVRGDDILFSLMNKFDIITLNGIACWGADFGEKHGPMTAYLDARYHLMICQNALSYSRFTTSLVLLKSFLLAAFSYNYASAKAILMALEHFNTGPNFWKNNIDLSEIRIKISNFTPSEKLTSNISSELLLKSTKGMIKWPKFIRLFFLQGAILPNFALRDTPILQHKSFHADLSVTFGHKKIIYWNHAEKSGYVAELNRTEFFTLSLRICREIIKLLFTFEKIKQSYTQEIPYLTSASYWRSVYNNFYPRSKN